MFLFDGFLVVMLSRNPVNSPVDVDDISQYSILVLAPSKRWLGMGFLPSIMGILATPPKATPQEIAGLINPYYWGVVALGGVARIPLNQQFCCYVCLFSPVVKHHQAKWRDPRPSNEKNE